MKKIDRAVEIIRGWSGVVVFSLNISRFCPEMFKMKDKTNTEQCAFYTRDVHVSCTACWNEEVEE